MGTPKILVVDDDPTNVELVQSILASEGFSTMPAGNGPSARFLCKTEQPDLILLDVMMPGETGFETCALMKSDPETAEIPIIFLSALDDFESKVAGLRMGGVDYISKPVHGEEVLARVRVHLHIRESRRILMEQNRAYLEQLRHAQRAILTSPADHPEASFAVFYEPLQEAGGDFYDVVTVSSNVTGFLVADISGHDVGAAFLTSAVKALLHQHSSPVYAPEDTMRGIGSVMRQILDEEQYLTACYARINRRTRQVSIVSAGHPPAILTRVSGEVETVAMDSEPLGMFDNAVLQHKTLSVNPGDRLFLYTDGLIESVAGGGRRAGLERLIASALRHAREPLDTVPAKIVADVCAGRPARTDDLLLLATEVRP